MRDVLAEYESGSRSPQLIAAIVSELRRARANNADLHARWLAVNEDRDYVAECNLLLAAKDAEVERLRALALRDADGAIVTHGAFNALIGQRDRLRERVAELEAEIERLRTRTHEIQEAADKRNAKLQSEVESCRQDRRWAHEQLAAYRQAGNVACESEFERLCVLDLRDEWQAEVERLRAEVDRCHRELERVSDRILAAAELEP